MRGKNLTGKTYGLLKVIEKSESLTKNGRTRARWLCKCDCGNEVIVFATYLQSGDTKSCGCIKKEVERLNLRKKYDSKRVDGVVKPLFKGKEPRKDSSTGYRGVTRYHTRVSKEERYRAWITVKGKVYKKAGFVTAKEAYYNGRLRLEKKHLPNWEEKQNEDK